MRLAIFPDEIKFIPLAERVQRHQRLSGVLPPQPIRRIWETPPEPVIELAPTWPENKTITRIKNTVAKYYGIPARGIESKSNRPKYVLPRQMAMYLSRVLTNKSYPYLAICFNRSHHSSVLDACVKIEKCLANGDTAVAYAVKLLIQTCSAAAAE